MKKILVEDVENIEDTETIIASLPDKLSAPSSALPPKESATVLILQEALADGKAMDVCTLSAVRQAGGLFSWMIVTTANSPRHAAALAERARLALKAAGLPSGHSEGGMDNLWVLLDAGDVIVHIMQAETRAHYDLESLWGFEEAGK